MIRYNQLRLKVIEHVNNPDFHKPILNMDYGKQGTVKLITKIRPNGEREKQN